MEHTEVNELREEARNRIAKTIKEGRKRASVHQSEVAQMTGLTRSQISRYENGVTEVPGSLLFVFGKLCKFSPVRYFCDGEDYLDIVNRLVAMAYPPQKESAAVKKNDDVIRVIKVYSDGHEEVREVIETDTVDTDIEPLTVDEIEGYVKNRPEVVDFLIASKDIVLLLEQTNYRKASKVARDVTEYAIGELGRERLKKYAQRMHEIRKNKGSS